MAALPFMSAAQWAALSEDEAVDRSMAEMEQQTALAVTAKTRKPGALARVHQVQEHIAKLRAELARLKQQKAEDDARFKAELDRMKNYRLVLLQKITDRDHEILRLKAENTFLQRAQDEALRKQVAEQQVVAGSAALDRCEDLLTRLSTALERAVAEKTRLGEALDTASARGDALEAELDKSRTDNAALKADAAFLQRSRDEALRKLEAAQHTVPGSSAQERLQQKVDICEQQLEKQRATLAIYAEEARVLRAENARLLKAQPLALTGTTQPAAEMMGHKTDVDAILREWTSVKDARIRAAMQRVRDYVTDLEKQVAGAEDSNMQLAQQIVETKQAYNAEMTRLDDSNRALEAAVEQSKSDADRIISALKADKEQLKQTVTMMAQAREEEVAADKSHGDLDARLRDAMLDCQSREARLKAALADCNEANATLRATLLTTFMRETAARSPAESPAAEAARRALLSAAAAPTTPPVFSYGTSAPAQREAEAAEQTRRALLSAAPAPTTAPFFTYGKSAPMTLVEVPGIVSYYTTAATATQPSVTYAVIPKPERPPAYGGGAIAEPGIGIIVGGSQSDQAFQELVVRGGIGRLVDELSFLRNPAKVNTYRMNEDVAREIEIGVNPIFDAADAATMTGTYEELAPLRLAKGVKKTLLVFIGPPEPVDVALQTALRAGFPPEMLFVQYVNVSEAELADILRLDVVQMRAAWKTFPRLDENARNIKELYFALMQ